MFKKILFSFSFVLIACVSIAYAQSNNEDINKTSSKSTLTNLSVNEVAKKKAVLKAETSVPILNVNTSTKKEDTPSNADIQLKIDYLIEQNCCIEDIEKLRQQLTNN